MAAGALALGFGLDDDGADLGEVRAVEVEGSAAEEDAAGLGVGDVLGDGEVADVFADLGVAAAEEGAVAGEGVDEVEDVDGRLRGSPCARVTGARRVGASGIRAGTEVESDEIARQFLYSSASSRDEVRDATIRRCGCGRRRGLRGRGAGGAAGDVVAVERGFERDGGEEVFAELGLRACAARRVVDALSSRFVVEAEADGVADDLVGFAEGDALVGEIGGGGHGVEVAGFGGALHTLEAEVEGAGEVGKDAEEAGEVSADVEDLLLAFLEVFVVGERQAFDQGGECGGCAEQAGGFAAGEFGEVGVFLLRHRGGAGGEGFGEVDEAEFGGGVEGELFGEARDVKAERGGGLREVEHEVAVGGGVHAVGRGGVKPRASAAMVRSSASVAPAMAPEPRGQRFMRLRASGKRERSRSSMAT